MKTDQLKLRYDLARPPVHITARPVVFGDERTTTSLICSSIIGAVAC
jgi:hypothetical protein